MSKYILFLFILSVFCFGYSEATDPVISHQRSSVKTSKVLYLLQSGHFNEAFNAYREQVKLAGQHDHELLEQMGVWLINEGYRSSEPELQLTALFGAGISVNEKLLPLLEQGIRSTQPEIQLACIGLLSQFQNDQADLAINRALSSNFILIRLEGIYQLAKKKSPIAVSQAEALMNKVPKELIPIFPQVFAMVGNLESMRILKKLMTHESEKVRIESILTAAKYGRDDLLPSIRLLITNHGIAQQEACAIALGMLKDQSSISKLERLALSGSSFVSLAALKSLYLLGKAESRIEIEKLAEKEDLFAIQLLGEIEGSEKKLHSLLKHNNLQVSVNAALALLKRKDSIGLPILREILIRDIRDLAIIKNVSNGKTLFAYKIVPSSQLNFAEQKEIIELSYQIKEEILQSCVSLPEKSFLALSLAILESRQNELIPSLVNLIASLKSSSAIGILKKYRDKVGAPLIRNYCNLALYKISEEGPYRESLLKWLSEQKDEDFILQAETQDFMKGSSIYQLAPKEKSQLIISCYEALLQMQDDKCLDILLEAIQNGKLKNRYALAGLLIRSSN